MTVLNDQLVEESLSRICETPAKIIPIRSAETNHQAPAAPAVASDILTECLYNPMFQRAAVRDRLERGLN